MTRVLVLIGGLLGVGAIVAGLLWALEDAAPGMDARHAASADGSGGTDAAAAPPPPRSDTAGAVADGYSGTAPARRRDRARAATAPTVRAEAPPSYYVADDDVGSFASRLARQKGYPELLQLLHRLGGRPQCGSVTDRRDDGTRRTTTRFHDEAPRMAALMDDALAAATSGVVRQALIFHMAIALPPSEAHPRLRALAASADAADAEDALCALAFTGDADALDRFEILARTPTTFEGVPLVRREQDAARLFAEGRRDVLRSHRCIEALDGAPYFHIHGLELDGVWRPFPWAEAYERPGDDVAGRALPAWLARYPGHAGSDDMAYRMALLRMREGRDVEALRWASFGATSPDGDMFGACASMTVSVVEFAPPGAAVTEDVIDPAAPDRNRDLLLYLRIRRHAQERGFGAAVREMADLAATEPGLVLSRAWRDRWSASVPRGLESGVAPLPADDPLRRLDAAPSGAGPRDASRAVRLLEANPERLRAQFRAWETMAALESRRVAASGAEAADLLYKQAALHFHERDVLYPVYANHTENYSWRPVRWYAVPARPTEDAEVTWLRGVLSWDLAVARFEELVRLDPRHPLADDAVHSTALAHVKAADDRAVRAAGDAERDRHLRAAIAAFERLLREYPESPFVPDASAALRYWRRARKDLL